MQCWTGEREKVLAQNVVYWESGVFPLGTRDHFGKGKLVEEESGPELFI